MWSVKDRTTRPSNKPFVAIFNLWLCFRVWADGHQIAQVCWLDKGRRSLTAHNNTQHFSHHNKQSSPTPAAQNSKMIASTSLSTRHLKSACMHVARPVPGICRSRLPPRAQISVHAAQKPELVSPAAPQRVDSVPTTTTVPTSPQQPNSLQQKLASFLKQTAKAAAVLGVAVALVSLVSRRHHTTSTTQSVGSV